MVIYIVERKDNKVLLAPIGFRHDPLNHVINISIQEVLCNLGGRSARIVKNVLGWYHV